MNSLHNARGFTLLETLIAVVLVGFAFLATAGLHIRSLRDTQFSAQEVAAAQIADDLSARLRVSSPLQLTASLQTAGTPTPACYTTTGCKATEMAADEIKKWKDSIALRLPGGGGTVCRDNAPGDGSPTDDGCSAGATDPVVIKLWWPLRQDDTTVNTATVKYRQFFLYYVPKT